MSSADLDAIRRAAKDVAQAPDPLAALGAAHQLRSRAETLEEDLVAQARAAGASWSKIGAIYGLTKQGAQQRFKKPIKPDAAPAPAEQGGPDA